MELIGLDVGFSKNRRTSGVAHISPEKGLTIGDATSEWADRARILHWATLVDVTAIDAPIVPSIDIGKRACETFFCYGKFQKRCKPGFSHVPGTGQDLRNAGVDTAHQLERVTSNRKLANVFPRVWGDTNIVEAFPNAFLGVTLDNQTFNSMPRLRRGEKFDWLYDQWCELELFDWFARAIGGQECNEIAAACISNQHHEERAALICLLTATSVATGRYTAVGDSVGGYFFLPPWQLWSSWARIEAANQRQRLPELEIWVNGTRYRTSDPLPIEVS